MTVSAVTCGGQPATLHARRRPSADRVGAAVDRAGGELSCTTTYRGVPGGGLRIINNIHGERTAFSENWPNNARHWLPMIDHPVRQGHRRVHRHGARALPGRGQRPAASRKPTSPADMRRTHWKQSVPIASWLYALGMARFTVRHYATSKGMPQQVWVFPQDADDGAARSSSSPDAAPSSSSASRSARTRTRSSPTCRPPASAAAPSTRP